MSEKNTDDLFHCPHCGSTEFTGRVTAFAKIQFRQGFSLDSDSKNTVWEVANEEPSWEPEVRELTCANEHCAKVLKEKALLTPKQWKTREEETKIVNKPW